MSTERPGELRGEPAVGGFWHGPGREGKRAQEVVGALGFIGHVLAMDALSSSKLTQERLGWRPTQPGLIADLERGTYFDTK